ncbi:hypothetical protein TNCT_202551, partial [Trichonephila clavata]
MGDEQLFAITRFRFGDNSNQHDLS